MSENGEKGLTATAEHIVAEIRKGDILVSGDRKDFGYLVTALETAVAQGWLKKEGEKYKDGSRKGKEIIAALLEREDTRNLVAQEVAEKSEEAKPIKAAQEETTENKEEVFVPKGELPKFTGPFEKTVGPSVPIEVISDQEARFRVKTNGENTDISSKETELKGIEAKIVQTDEKINELQTAAGQIKDEITKVTELRGKARERFSSRKVGEEKNKGLEVINAKFLTDRLDEIADFDLQILDLENSLAITEIQINSEKTLKAGLEQDKRVMMGEIALAELTGEAGGSQREIKELIYNLNLPNTTISEILSLMHGVELSDEELEAFKQLQMSGEVRMLAGGGKESLLMINLAERLKQQANNEFFLNNPELATLSVEDRYKKAMNLDTNLVETLQMVGTPEDIRRVEALFGGENEHQPLLEINPSGEIVPIGDEGQITYDQIRQELINRISEKYHEEMIRNAEQALENNPLIKAVEKEIQRLEEELTRFKYEDPETKSKPKFPFNKKGQLYKRFFVATLNNHALDEYDRKVEQFHKMEDNISQLEIALKGFNDKKAELTIDEVALKMGLCETMLDFNPISPDMEKITMLLGQAEAVTPFETYESQEAIYLREKLGEKFQAPELTPPPTRTNLYETVNREEFDRIREDLEAELDHIVEKALNRAIRGLKDETLRNKVKNVAFNSREFKAVLDAAILEKGISLKLAEMGSIDNVKGLDFNQARFLLCEMYELEADKGNRGDKIIDFKKFVEELTLKYKFNQVTKEAEESMKVMMADFLEADDPEALKDKTVKEIILEGNSLTANALQAAGAAHQAILSGVYSVGEFGDSVGESWNGLKLALAGENKATFERKMNWSERKSKLNRKNERHKGLLAQLMEAFWGK